LLHEDEAHVAVTELQFRCVKEEHGDGVKAKLQKQKK
jgi:hypothetical protein